MCNGQSLEQPGSHSSQDRTRSEGANRLSASGFANNYVNPIVSQMDWPAQYSISFRHSSNIKASELDACLGLVRATSAKGYKASTWGWCSKKKLHEMKDKDMRFLLVHSSLTSFATADNSRIGAVDVAGFLSFMLTVEDGIEVIYCYEIHLSPELRGRKIGAMLMQSMEGIGKAVGVSKAMLTVFTSDASARAFYEQLGYTLYDEEAPLPQRKRLKSRVVEETKPTYVILAKDLC